MPDLSRRTRLLTAAGAAVLLTLAACQGGPDPAARPSPTPSPASSAFPLTVTNCGVEVTLPAPPERVVTIKSAATELVLALGAGDRLVGTAFADGPVPDQWAEEGIPVLAEKLPAAEVVLAAEPDLIVAGWESNLTADGVGERDHLADLGIAGYVLPAACQEPEFQPNPLTFEQVFDQITEVGRILDVPGAAADLVAEQHRLLETIEPATGDLTALWYSSGSDTPFVGGGIGAPELIMSTAGLTNIEAGIDDTWASVSWEAVAAADPDVIVLVDSTWNTAEHKREVLAGNPVTAALDAVANERYLVVPFPASEAGVRTAWAAADLAEQLDALAQG
ncbi:putative F420-0 ABC transporter substrate-binding protein [Pseudactinotalea sp. HY158]|uniref:putative F420-0 ABC transporter substrate-binding protein n=1 Tax=Pseudactinotalea sp. HY158 TaxID=2654547 RepID=UPI001E2CD27C|nr:putative F420-0 ABC transporter substrate-binding protein [Pseudactinotalea sp. HY158]